MPFDAFDSTTATDIAGEFGAPTTGGSRGKTLQTIRNELILAIGGERGDLEDSVLNGWINDALEEMQDELDLSDELRSSLSFTSESGQMYYNLPDGVEIVDGATMEDSEIVLGCVSLSKIRDLEVWRRLPAGDIYGSDARIEFFYQNNSILCLWPEPSGQEITLDFSVRAQPLTEDEQKPAIDARWHSALVQKARFLALSRLEEYDKAAAAQNEYLANVRAKITRRAREAAGTHASIRPVRNKSDYFRQRPWQ